MQKYVYVLREKDLKVSISKNDTNFEVRGNSWRNDFARK